MSPLILTSALVDLLIESLEQPETADLVSARLTTDLRELRARLEVELEASASRKLLHMADPPPDSSVAAED
jgi:hypothetical protein